MSTIVFSPDAPAPIGPYSQGIVTTGALLFCSGQVALDQHGALIGDDVATQTAQVFRNINYVLQAGGATLADVVKTTVFLKSMNDFAAMNAVYAENFGSTTPARSTVEVARLPKDALVEIEVIASVRG